MADPASERTAALLAAADLARRIVATAREVATLADREHRFPIASRAWRALSKAASVDLEIADAERRGTREKLDLAEIQACLDEARGLLNEAMQALRVERPETPPWPHV